MKIKTKNLLLSMLSIVLLLTSISSTAIASAKTKINLETEISASKDISKNESKVLALIKLASENNQEAINKIENLQMFKEDKSNNQDILLSKENPIVEIEFEDGSSIEYNYTSESALNKIDIDGSQESSVTNLENVRLANPRNEKVTKKYKYLGVNVASLTCNARVKYVSRTTTRIERVWVDAWSTGSISGTGASILENNVTVARCEAHGKYQLMGGIAWSELMNLVMWIDSTSAVGIER